jgi:hypothetical protein
MRRSAFRVLFTLVILSCFARAQSSSVQVVGDMSFAVPEGWIYSGAQYGDLTR